MNPPQIDPQRRRWILRGALLLIPVCALAVLVIGVTGFVRLGADARCLRNSLTHAPNSSLVSWNKKVELSVGAITFQVLRAGLSLAPLPDEARTALRAVRGAEVGIYRLGAGSSCAEPGPLLLAADESMSSRGWDRIVGVVKEQDLVAVYVPRKPAAGMKLQVCVAVLSRDQLIVASGRSDLGPLMELAMSHPEWKRSHQWIAAQL